MAELTVSGAKAQGIVGSNPVGLGVVQIIQGNPHRSRLIISSSGAGQITLWIDSTVSLTKGIVLGGNLPTMIFDRDQMGGFVVRDLWATGSLAGSVVSWWEVWDQPGY
jgi:hypothetical protein